MRLLFGLAQVLIGCAVIATGCAKLDFFRRTETPAPSEKGLCAGMAAPEIEGTDFDNVPFKLSDYRGKVVVLSFWTSW